MKESKLSDFTLNNLSSTFWYIGTPIHFASLEMPTKKAIKTTTVYFWGRIIIMFKHIATNKFLSLGNSLVLKEKKTSTMFTAILVVLGAGMDRIVALRCFSNVEQRTKF